MPFENDDPRDEGEDKNGNDERDDIKMLLDELLNPPHQTDLSHVAGILFGPCPSPAEIGPSLPVADLALRAGNPGRNRRLLPAAAGTPNFKIGHWPSSSRSKKKWNADRRYKREEEAVADKLQFDHESTTPMMAPRTTLPKRIDRASGVSFIYL